MNAFSATIFGANFFFLFRASFFVLYYPFQVIHFLNLPSYIPYYPCIQPIIHILMWNLCTWIWTASRCSNFSYDIRIEFLSQIFLQETRYYFLLLYQNIFMFSTSILFVIEELNFWHLKTCTLLCVSPLPGYISIFQWLSSNTQIQFKQDLVSILFIW